MMPCPPQRRRGPTRNTAPWSNDGIANAWNHFFHHLPEARVAIHLRQQVAVCLLEVMPSRTTWVGGCRKLHFIGNRIGISRPDLRSRTTATAVVNKYRRRAGYHIVGVGAGDGEVVDGGVLGADLDGGDLGPGAGGGVE